MGRGSVDKEAAQSLNDLARQVRLPSKGEARYRLVPVYGDLLPQARMLPKAGFGSAPAISGADAPPCWALALCA